MPDISIIENGESGLSVRNKLNELILAENLSRVGAKNILDAKALGKTYAAYGDGVSRTVESLYGDLAAAQVDYPNAVAGGEIDETVFEYCLINEINMRLPYISGGSYLFNYSFTFSNVTCAIDFEVGANIKVTEEMTYTMYGTSGCDITTCNMEFDGNDLSFGLLRLDSSSWTGRNTYVHNIGNLVGTAPALAFGVLMDDPKFVHIDGFKGRVINVIGNGAFGDGVGAARFLALGTGVVSTQVGYSWIYDVDLDASGSDAEELDLFQMNIDNTEGGVIFGMRLRYNEKCRRAFKMHATRWNVYGLDVRPLAGFTPVSGSTDVGEKCLNCVDWSNNGDGLLQFFGGYIDASGFKYGMTNSGGIASYQCYGLHLKGGTKRVIRNNPETGSPEDVDHVGFFTASAGGHGSAFRFGRIEGFTTAVLLQGDYGEVSDSTIVDPVEFAAYIGSSSNRKNIKFSRNKVITKTLGYLNNSRIVRVFDVTDVEVNNNILIRDGNTGHATTFIGFTDSDATGFCIGTFAANLTTPVSIGTSKVIERGTNGVENMSTFNKDALGNTSTTETDLRALTIPIGRMDAAGKFTIFEAYGTSANNANAKTLNLYFGGSLIGTYSLATSTAGEWHIRACIAATSASAQDSIVEITENGATTTYRNFATTAIDGTAAIIAKVTGTGGASNDIILQIAKLTYENS